MTDPAGTPRRPRIPPSPDPPALESPPWEDVLGSLPSKEEVVESAPSVDEIVNQQPSVDQLLGRDR
jgi:hypothetical protein